jgi:hypothetical protein
MAGIQLLVTDQTTQKDVLLTVSMHDAQKLYRALREIIGDVQYGAQPGELVTVPNARINVGGG